jgi:hypothetical protein
MAMKSRVKYYPADWEAIRRGKLEAAAYRCQECGVQDCAVLVNSNKKHPLFPDGQPYMVHLNLAHKNEYETWNWSAETVVLCSACHGRFDRKNRRKDAGKKQNPIGWLVVQVWTDRGWVAAADPWSWNELYRVVSAFAVGTEFLLEFRMAFQSLGLGRYVKQERGVQVVTEEGIGCDFGLTLAGIPSEVVYLQKG